jgi:segregation and condensation protein A
MAYKVKLPIFEGPLDLLLYLVKKDHINIYDIPIASLTQQYLEYLELMRLLDLEIAGEFLVVAATLLEIKSKMLLPAEAGAQQEQPQEDPRAELARQLLEYERFKEIAEELRRKEQERKEVFIRPSSQKQEYLSEEKEVYFEASLFDLINVFSQALKEVPVELFYEVIKDEFTIEEKIHQILHLLVDKSAILLSELFKNAKNKLEIIATFIGILELIRLKEIIVRQRYLFGDIEVIRNKENIQPYARRKV